MEFSSSYLASQVLKLFWNYKIPVDIQSIAKKLEIDSTTDLNLDNKFLICFFGILLTLINLNSFKYFLIFFL